MDGDDPTSAGHTDRFTARAFWADLVAQGYRRAA